MNAPQEYLKMKLYRQGQRVRAVGKVVVFGFVVFTFVFCTISLSLFAASQEDKIEKAIILSKELLRQGRYSDAEKVLLNTLQETEKDAGDNFLVAVICNHLANIYYEQGKCREAEGFEKLSIRTMEKLPNVDQACLARASINLITIYVYCRNYAKAERLYQRTLELDLKARGPDSPGIASMLDNRATIHLSRGEFLEAEALYLQSLAILEKKFGAGCRVCVRSECCKNTRTGS
jgi:tetratricopeptide (TPR) repeat protein